MNMILRIFLFVILCIVLGGTTLPTLAQSNPPDDFDKVDAYVFETLRRLPIKGLAVAIVRGEQIIYMKGYGIANKQGEPVTPQTPFMMGSVTKSFTALAVHQLIKAGNIKASNPVQMYVPALRVADASCGADVTIRHLLDHTSGISTEEGDQYYLLLDTKITFPEALDRLARFRPKYKPGEHYEYSNWNYALLREVIAQASGQSYTEYMQQHILDPLGMSQSSFGDHYTLPHAATYDLNVFGFPVPYHEPYVPVHVGAAQLSASVEDMAHFAIAFLNRAQYQGHNLLPTRDRGGYNSMWEWETSEPYSFIISGSHNSTYSSMLLDQPNRLSVVVLMNTRLDEIITSAPTPADIAANIANMMMGKPYSLPNFNGFYVWVILMDGLLLIFIGSIVWQGLRLKNWRKQYQGARPARRLIAWLGIVLDLLLCAFILAIPLKFHLHWYTLLTVRPDFSIPVLVVGVCLGALGLVKTASSLVFSRLNTQGRELTEAV